MEKKIINGLEEMANFTFTTKYAKFDEKKGRRETWEETVSRVEKMHLRKFNFLPLEDKQEISRAFDMVRRKSVTPSMRSMQFGGKAIEAHNSRMYNCGVRHIDSLRSFAESFYTLLCGTGVGYGITNFFLNRLPDLVEASDKTGTIITYVVQDNIEGWGDSIEALMNCYFKNTPYSGRKIVFDYSRIRPKGAKLKTGGGKAPGYKGLKNAHKKVKALLDRIIEDYDQKRLKTIDAYDVLMHCADAVLSGGIRRSACSVIFEATDSDMMNAKTGNWFAENPQRARSNNSAIIVRGQTTFEEFKALIEKTKQFGEPGFLYVVDNKQLLNPCVTGDTLIATSEGLRFSESLVGERFTAMVDGEKFSSTQSGFWKTGEKETLTLSLASGRKLELTGNHKVMTSEGWVEAENLMVGDLIKINNQRSHLLINKDSADFAKGYLLGAFLSDGNVGGNYDRCEIKLWGDNKNVYRKKIYDYLGMCGWLSNHHKETSDNNSEYSVISSSKLFSFAKENGCLEVEKHLSKRAISGKSPDFLSGLISGYFDADGSVALNSQKGNSIRILSSQLINLENIQIILNYLGIFSKIYTNRLPEGFRLLPDGKGGSREFLCKATHEICISCDNIEEFAKKIFPFNEKKAALISDIISFRKRTPNKTVWLDEVSNIVKNEGLKSVYDAEIENIHSFDANSLYVHNCFEISFIPITPDGRCGFQYCNLSSINGAKVTSLEEFKEASWAASLIGTLQAAYTDFPYLGHTSEELSREEALLGVSITGMMDNPDILFNPEYQRASAMVAVETNRIWAKKIGINQAARVTCVKPEGTSSIVLSSASGIHPHHARRYFRRIQINKEDNVYKFFRLYNDHACEESVWSENKTDDVITFPIEVGEKAMIKSDLSAVEHLNLIKSTQENWVNSGTTEANKKPLNHSVSCTVMVKDDEWESVTKYLFDNQEKFTAVSLLPSMGDKIYKQAPMEAVLTAEDEVKFDKLLKEWSKVDYKKLEESEDSTSFISEVACGGGKCVI